MKEDAKKYLEKCKDCTHKLQQDSKKEKKKNFNIEYTRVRYDDFFQGSRILDKLLQCNQEVIKKKKICTIFAKIRWV